MLSWDRKFFLSNVVDESGLLVKAGMPVGTTSTYRDGSRWQKITSNKWRRLPETSTAGQKEREFFQPLSPAQKVSLMAKTARRKKGEGVEVTIQKNELGFLLDHGIFGIVSAGKNPNLEPNMTDEEQKVRDVKLKDELKKRGFTFTRSIGKYGGEESSYMVMVHNSQKKELIELGKMFNQESVLQVNGGSANFIYTGGEKAGKEYEDKGWGIVPDADDLYTRVKTDDGGEIKFAYNIHPDTFKAMIAEALDGFFYKAGVGQGIHKYIKREGVKGKYRYWYNEATGKREKKEVKEEGEGKASALAPVLKEFEKSISGLDYEVCGIFDETGRKHYSALGNKNSVAIPPKVSRASQGRVLTHNHPSGRGFSLDDIQFAVIYGLKEIRAVGRKSKTYRFVVPEAVRKMDAKERYFLLNEVLNSVDREIFKFLSGEMDSGKITAADAEVAHPDMVMKTFVKKMINLEIDTPPGSYHVE
jgi:hypothetical protein